VRRTGVRILSYAACGRSAGSACIAGALLELRTTPNDTRKPQSSVLDRTFDTLGTRATNTVKWGWEGGPSQSPGRDLRIAAA